MAAIIAAKERSQRGLRDTRCKHAAFQFSAQTSPFHPKTSGHISTVIYMIDRCSDHDGQPDPYAAKTSKHPTQPLPLKLRDRIPSPLPPKLILSLPPAPSVSLILPTQPNQTNPIHKHKAPSPHASPSPPPSTRPTTPPSPNPNHPLRLSDQEMNKTTHISNISHIPKHTRNRDDVHDRQPGRARRPAEVFVSVDVHVFAH